MIAILAMRASIARDRLSLCGRHHRQLTGLHDDAALAVDDDVVIVEPVLADLHRGRPTHSVHPERHGHRHVAAQHREKRVRSFGSPSYTPTPAAVSVEFMRIRPPTFTVSTQQVRAGELQ